ncbi:unnamed protein product [Onchocerca flexuosa]|uniref:Dimethylargininase n=1 Tax=Onchocerca flexuosa TaxID=387005 RepID=A0A183I1P0_9BILA|nr:unnamed protein product [Onchocerca flexuosa]
MGIDKSDVRYVIHHSLPKSLENYYQESGRVGRDGNEAYCILFYRLNDLFRQSTMVCTEKTGVRNLYSVLSYCTQTSECRRSIIAEHFNAEWDSSLCSKMCDICSQINDIEYVDVTDYWRLMLEVLKNVCHAQKTDNNRITGMKLVELTWKKAGSVSRELIELLVAKLILEGYLKVSSVRFCKCEGGSIDMRYTHAIIVRVPNSLKMEKKTKIDLSLAEKQLEELCETLREAGVDIIELSPEEHCLQHNLFTGDAAICINGTALITRPKKNGSRLHEISNLLNQLAWQVIETPQASEHNKEVVLEGSDVLYTGKEVFVGIRKNGTNMEGALVVARTFSDLAVIPITLPGNQPLRHYVSLISTDVLTVGSSKEAKQVIQRMERQATFRYKTLTVKNDDAVNCLNVNDYVIYRQDTPDAKFQILHEPIQMVGITADELAKIGSPISRLVLLTTKMKTLKSLW